MATIRESAEKSKSQAHKMAIEDPVIWFSAQGRSNEI